MLSGPISGDPTAAGCGLVRRRRIEALTEALEAQREAIVEHFQRWTEARGEAGKRAVEEIGRTDREARDLLVRLAEGTAGSVQEQPL